MNLYPRSFLRLILLGNVFVVLPLLAAIAYASITVESLTLRSEESVRQASRAAALGHSLQEEFNQMARILRQFEVLRDPSLLEEYGKVRQEWARTAREYALIPLLTDLRGRVGAMQQAEVAAYQNLGAHAEGFPQLKTTLDKLNSGLHPLLDDAKQLVERDHEMFREQATKLRERLIAALLVALALSALFLWLARRMVARLWRRFERAVYALGEGQLKRRIQLKGPEDLQRVGRRLEWLRRRMQNLENERNRIMRHASHELKTPLATLREGASLLGEGLAGPLTPQQTKIVGIMQTNAIRLQALIDSLLRMQQASHAREHMDVTAIRFDEVIGQTLATHQLAARNRQLRISGSLAPLTVEGGGEALATMATNLISNAIKFSPDGGVVKVTLTQEGQMAVLDVIDAGPGISAEDRERIFQPFYRGTAGKGVAGVGLGLAIANDFALAHGGSLEIIDSERGAHFRASLPLLGKAA